MPGHILPHSHGESMNTEHILHVISQTDNFQTVAESFKNSRRSDPYPYFLGCSAIAKNVSLTFPL